MIRVYQFLALQDMLSFSSSGACPNKKGAGTSQNIFKMSRPLYHQVSGLVLTRLLASGLSPGSALPIRVLP
ncbi:hypothetical protein DhcVS_594 [Dehalococcoides mccartyi VS]|uniref:Uncharacterized protein n=1 Tax=Dehalococcoides mccartyi (strain VS) TaxID=311424 RepID=D2BHE3_DEHMV|nr:hypothetical protein DhcVS_594 [Dehalococcoides mccartyi VS]